MSQAQTFFHCQPRCRRSTDSSVFFCDHVIREPNLSLKIAGVGAIRVGYESDAAFSKAFKRVLGLTPGEHRRNGMRRSQPTAV